MAGDDTSPGLLAILAWGGSCDMMLALALSCCSCSLVPGGVRRHVCSWALRQPLRGLSSAPVVMFSEDTSACSARLSTPRQSLLISHFLACQAGRRGFRNQLTSGRGGL